MLGKILEIIKNQYESEFGLCQLVHWGAFFGYAAANFCFLLYLDGNLQIRFQL